MNIKSKMNKCYKIIEVIKNVAVNLPPDALLRIYNLFIRPHLDYTYFIYDKRHNKSFKNKTENIQHKTCIAITVPIQEHHENTYTVNWAWNL